MNIQDVVHNGRYKIIELIGSGSQAKVYKIEDLHDNNKMYN
jgi:serine/threonine protein kinase